MTRTLHSVWLPSTHTNVEQPGTLALWAESTHPRQTTTAIEHPRAVSTATLDQLLIHLRFFRHSVQRQKTHYLTLALPTSGKGPVSSGPSAPPARGRRASTVTLQPWRVETILIAPAQVLAFLLQLPETPTTTIEIGPDVRYWQSAARLIAAALMRGQFSPTATEAGRGRWHMLLMEAELQTLAAQLEQAMPPAARALAHPLPAPRDLLHDFLNTVGGQMVAESYGPSQTPFQRIYDYRKPPHLRPADWWWMDLFPRTNAYYTYNTQFDAKAQVAFGEAARNWATPIHRYLTSVWRVAFRLEPPPSTETIDSEAPEWRLSFHLQPKDQPETLWAASEVWENPPDPEMRAILQEGLLQAAAIYPRLAMLMEDPQPVGLWLNIGEAVEFLETHSTALSQQGFGVLVPTWWKDRARKLNARVALQKWNEGSGLFGMNSLVDFNWELAIGDHALTPEEFLTLAQSKTALVQVRGEWMQLNPEEVQAALKLAQRHQKSKGKLTLREALGLALTGPAEWEGLEVESLRVDDWLTEMTNRLAGHQPMETLPQPTGFVGQLRPYQLNGLAWLNFMRQYGFGACLADDMGLGKTIQVLALLQNDFDAQRLIKPTLLICPTTVVNNWVKEAEHFAPKLRVYAHHGPARFKSDEFAQAVVNQHLVVTSYALLPRDLGFLNQVQWGGVVLDEAHNIKNPTTKQAQAARQIAERAEQRFALTGTPVENRLQDLWSILHFLNPGYLGSTETFQKTFAGPIERGTDPRAGARLRALTRPFILRRLKTDQTIIQDLPPKNEMKEYCGLTKEQAALYKAVVQESLRQIAAAEGIQRRGIILATLTKLKQVCNHPRHLLGDLSALKHRSGKLNRLTEMLEQALAEDDRCLIFTQYAEMGALLQEYLTEAFGETLYLHGGTPALKRAELIERFQDSGPRLFVLSLKAGGAGINLTRANRVFHYDRWWNPAVENQATDRAFRIGQTRSVQVHKLVCRGTLEERVDELITRKTALAEEIVGSGEGWLTELSTDELRDLLVLRRDAIDD